MSQNNTGDGNTLDPNPNPNLSAKSDPALPTTTPTDKPAPGGAAFASSAIRRHGTGIRGLDLSRQSVQFEGRFGRMFRTLPAAVHDEDDLRALAAVMTADPDPLTPESEDDDEENTGISAGYTYLGQFIDHDLTFDPASSLQRQNDPDGLTDYRTPRFDLDNIYGRGPDDQPYLYQDDGVRMLLGRQLTGSANDPNNTRDVPRNSPGEGPMGGTAPRRAMIGDPRNDENVIVSNLQATMLRFHNSVADALAARLGAQPRFEQVQREVRFHYQWVVLHDFLPTIIGRDRVLELLGEIKDDGMRQGPDDSSRGAFRKAITEFKPNLRFYQPKHNAYMPVEFSVAAYRFGHSMVRPVYRLNTTLKKEDFQFSDDGRQVIFASVDPAHIAESLTGFRDFPTPWAVDWNLFFRIGENDDHGPKRLQPAYKIDTSLVNPLGNLPAPIATGVTSLAGRNLLRGLRLSLPSGQAVARAMGFTPIEDDDLHVGKANEADTPTNKRLTDISADFGDNAPLWYYVLAEAQQAFRNDKTPIRLGEVGGTIVGEVFVGLLFQDSFSYVNQHPNWLPFSEFTGSNGIFGMAELIRAARGETIGRTP